MPKAWPTIVSVWPSSPSVRGVEGAAQAARMALMVWTAVWNETRGERLLGRVCRCASFLCRLRGLTFCRSLGDDEGLLLVGRRESRADTAIHMFFVFFPIAAIWLDRSGRVVDAQLACPFRPLYVPRAPARDVLEGPPTLLERVGIGDQLRFGG